MSAAGAAPLPPRVVRAQTGRVLDLVVVLAVLTVPLAPLTAVGARRRGNGWVLAVLAGLVFPLTWVHWYVSDEVPLRRAGGA